MTRTTTFAFAFLAAFAVACGGSTPPPEHPDTPPPLDDGNPPPSDGPTAPASSAKVQEGIDAIKANDFEKAKAILTQAHTDNPKDAQAAFYLGVATEQLGDKAGAIDLYKQALALDAGLVDASVNLSALLLDQNDAKGALEVATAGLKKAPKHPDLLMNRALALEATGDTAGAVTAYGAAVAAAPDNVEARIAYAQLLAGAGQKDKAVEELKQVKTDDPQLLGAVANLFGKLGAPSECVAILDKPIAAKPSPDLLVRRGACRHDLKDANGEKADYDAALKLKPDFAPAHYYLGLYYRAAGKKKDAMAELEKAAAGGGGVGKAAQTALDEIKGGK